MMPSRHVEAQTSSGAGRMREFIKCEFCASILIAIYSPCQHKRFQFKLHYCVCTWEKAGRSPIVPAVGGRGYDAPINPLITSMFHPSAKPRTMSAIMNSFSTLKTQNILFRFRLP